MKLTYRGSGWRGEFEREGAKGSKKNVILEEEKES